MNFKNDVLKSTKPVLVEFSADWCGPCKKLAPTLARFADKHKDKITVITIDVDSNFELAQSYGIIAVPSMLLFVNGEVVQELAGRTVLTLEHELQEYL